MTLKLKDLGQMLRLTLTDPGLVARQILSLRLTEVEGLMALAACAAILTLLTALVQAVLGPVDNPMMQVVLERPVLLALSQFGVTVAGAWLMYRLGRAFGGTGSFAGALALVAWLEFVQIVLQAIEIVAIMVIPLVAVLVGLASIFAYFYLLTHFTAALNGFKSLGKVFLAVCLAGLALVIAFSFLLILVIPVSHV
jgi:hypothetical protein